MERVQNINKTLKFFFLFTLIYIFKDFFLIVQLNFFGRILMPSAIIKLLILLYASHIFIYTVVSKNRIFYDGLSEKYFILLLATLVSTFFLFRLYPMKYVAYTWFFQFFWLFVFYIVYICVNIDDKLSVFVLNLFRRVFVFMFCVNIVLGLLQFFLNSTVIVLPESGVMQFHALNTMMSSTQKAFGFFSDPLSFGMFCVFMFNFFSLEFFSKNNKKIKLFLMILATVGVYISLTRNVYVMYFVSLLFLFGYLIRSKRFLRYVPVCGLSISLIIMFIRSLLVNIMPSIDISSVQSLLIRLNLWRGYLDLFNNYDFVDRLVGIGIIQSTFFETTKGVLIDNTFIALLLCGGYIVLFLFLYAYFQLYKECIKKIFEVDNFYVASICVLSAYLALSVYNNLSISLYNFFFIPIIMLIVTRKRREE